MVGKVFRSAAVALDATLLPPPNLSLSEWADRERIISAPAAEPGRWKTSRVPYLREIMDSMTDKTIHTVVVMKAGQVGFSETLSNAVGYFMDQEPCSILAIQPTLEKCEEWSKERLAPMLRDTPCLIGKVAEPRSRDSNNTLRTKSFPGGHLSMVGANAPSGLASRAIRVLLADEIDHYAPSAGTEGDPLALAEVRQRTFWDRKTFLGSTPVHAETSVIFKRWLLSDQRQYHVPCPHCGGFQYLKWEQVRWSRGEDGRHLPDTAAYVCESCGVIWHEAERHRAITQGKWIADAPEHRSVAGFHLPGLLSPWVTLPSMARDWLVKYRDPTQRQVFVNTSLGLPFEDTIDAIQGNTLLSRREVYGPEALPNGVLLLTAGVDVQRNRLEMQVLGWGFREECWHVDYHVVHGDPTDGGVWNEIDVLLRAAYRREAGHPLRIVATCIDSAGVAGSQVFAYTSQTWRRRILPIRGSTRGAHEIWPKVDAVRHAQANKAFVISVDSCKEILYARLQIEKPGPGYLHFPDAVDEEFFAQLTAERPKTTRDRFGRPVREWILPPGRANEVLDTWVYALAALRSLPRGTLDRLATAGAPQDSAAPVVALGAAEGGPTGPASEPWIPQHSDWLQRGLVTPKPIVPAWQLHPPRVGLDPSWRGFGLMTR